MRSDELEDSLGLILVHAAQKEELVETTKAFARHTVKPQQREEGARDSQEVLISSHIERNSTGCVNLI
ncbi:hypothetical protein EAI_02244 [Harpegnathos saltator]|uniref:Uncharacterized protein n=1 Tax=Harpegnathos saltator TaxID=610380 RepID=E2BLU1_HARSA|nr:hypothetical protein EAI_02244 [Harpegnathos saltator]